jgi:signal transduction histidine kinase
MIEPHALPFLLSAAYSAALATVVIIKNHRSLVNRVFFALLLTTSVWQIATSAVVSATFQEEAYLASKIGFTAIALIPILTYHLIIAFLRTPHRATLTAGYLTTGLIIIPLNWANIFLDEPYHYSWGYWYKAAYPHREFLIIFALYSTMSFYLLIKHLKKEQEPVERNRIKLVNAALLIGYIGALDFIPTYGMPLYPPSVIFLMISFSLFTYAIVKYRLMNVHLVLKKSLVYSLSAGLLTGVFIVLTLTLLKIISLFTHIDSYPISIFTALLISFLFNPIKNRMQQFVDTHFYKGSDDHYDTIRTVTTQLALASDISTICVAITDALTASIKIDNTSFYIRSDETLIPVCQKVHQQPLNMFGTNDQDSPPLNTALVEQLENRKDVILKEDLHGKDGRDVSPLEQTLTLLNTQAVVPIFIDGKLDAVITLGKKLSGEIYTDHDIDLLRIIANSAAISIKSSRIYQDKVRSEKLATVGLIAVTLAHEIKNPLASIKTFFQLLPERYNTDPDFRETFSRIIPNEIRRIDTLVTELLELSRQNPKESALMDINVTDIMEDALKLFSLHLQDAGITISRNFASDLQLRGNRDKMKQAIINLISNACQSMTKGGYLKLTTEQKDNLIKLYIQDTGCGIAQKNIKHIFDPFFTTKDIGIGLGLPISKQIIESMGGTIEVHSQELVGTTYVITFEPLVQEAQA